MAGFSYNGNGEVALNPEDPKPSQPVGEKPGSVQENLELDEFFRRLPANFRWPKPNAEAVAAAVEAIQRMSGGTGTEELPAEPGAEPGNNNDACAGCGGSLPAAARFCVWCGLAKHAGVPGAGASVAVLAVEQALAVGGSAIALFLAAAAGSRTLCRLKTDRVQATRFWITKGSNFSSTCLARSTSTASRSITSPG